MMRDLTTRFATLAVACALFAPGQAMAWDHLLHAWLPSDMPLEYYVAADKECEETVPADYCREATEEAWDIWMSTPCVEFEAQYAGECPNVGYDPSNGELYNTFNDPDDELDGGAIAAALTVAAGLAFQLDGKNYEHAFDSDIVYNNNSTFDTRDRIADNQCNGGFDMVNIAVHEIGHTLGLAHTCEENELCTDPLLRNAIMYWTGSACVNQDPNQDDLEGLTALYGPYAGFNCSHQVSDDLALGVVPFELKCVVTAEFVSEVTGALWRFGDGGSSEELAATHTYETPGNYTVQVTVEGERDECGEQGWEYNFRRVGYVRACGLPDVGFTFEHSDGLTYQMYNETDVSVYGCIQDIQWEVYRGSGNDFSDKNCIDDLTVKVWEPLLTFPSEGTYTVVANIGGPAGTAAASMTFDATSKRGDGYGCSSVGSMGALGVTGTLAVMLTLFRRRQD
jgi:hypothetical protein